jgi:hypothetical protein
MNWARYRAEQGELASRIRALKCVLGTRWVAPMGAAQRELQCLKLRVTELCALRAFARGKLHLKRAPAGAAADWDAVTYHRRISERLAPSYSLQLEKSA